ncbi:MAG: HAD family hydrolase [Bryobacteraceae bacterium]
MRAVIFDFGGVLCFHPDKDQIARAAALCNLEPTQLVRAMWANRLPYDAGLDPNLYWRDVAARAGCSFDDALITRMAGCELDFWSRFDRRMLDWNDRLRESGIRTAVLSNLPRPLGTHLRTLDGFLQNFDHITFSYELGVTKPDRAIYEDAVRGLRVAPQDALFLDDRPENVEGARAAGLAAELFVSWDRFVEEIPARYGLPAPAMARRQ